MRAPVFSIPVAQLLALLLLAPTPASAQDPAAAEALFHSAQQAAQEGEWALACERFSESNRLDPAPGTVLNLARCHEELGHLASAWRYYQEAADRLSSTDQRAVYASDKVAELEPQVPKVVFLPPDEGEFELTVNGTPYSSAMMGMEMPFDPGEIMVVIESPDRRAIRATLSLSPGDVLTYQIELGTRISPPPHVQASSAPSKLLPVTLLTVGGLGAAAAVIGGVWAGIELKTASDPDHCMDGNCDQKGAHASARGRSAVVLMGTGAAVAAVGIGLGTVLLLKNNRGTALAVTARPGGGMVSFSANLPRLFAGPEL